MAVPGWYPDPGGDPNRHRYWDGAHWTGQTRPASAQPGADPTGAEPTGTAPTGTAPTGTAPTGPRRGVLLAAAALAVIVLVAAVVWFLPDDDHSSDPGPVPPSSTVSAWDETSSPDPSAERPVSCDLPTTDQLPAPADDGRTHGGPLSFASLPDPWSAPHGSKRFPFSRDSYVQAQRIESETELGWQASAQVGVVEMEDYPGPEPAANILLQCLMTSDFYRSVDVTLAESEYTEVDITGTPGVRVDALLTFDHPDLNTRGSEVRIIVVETDPTTYYFHAVPQESADLITELDTATDSLSVN